MTFDKNKKSIKKLGLQPNKAPDKHYDGKLTAKDAPEVVFFSAGKQNGQLPKTSPYPYSKTAEFKKIVRILVPINVIKLKTDYTIYKVNEGVLNKSTQQHLYMCIRNDYCRKNWCEQNLQSYNEIQDKSLFYIKSDDEIYCIKMEQQQIVNLCFPCMPCKKEDLEFDESVIHSTLQTKKNNKKRNKNKKFQD